MDLLSLPPHELLAATTVLWMDWLTLDPDVRKAHGRFIATLAQASTPSAVTEMTAGGTEDNPFPNVMKTGSVGVVGSKT